MHVNKQSSSYIYIYIYFNLCQLRHLIVGESIFAVCNPVSADFAPKILLQRIEMRYIDAYFIRDLDAFVLCKMLHLLDPSKCSGTFRTVGTITFEVMVILQLSN